MIDNYSCNGNFQVKEIKRPERKIFEVNFEPSHLITLFTDKSPNGNLEIKLKNLIPPWISQTDRGNESNMENDTSHTYGFNFLIDAISEAYDYQNKELPITTFNIEITN